MDRPVHIGGYIPNDAPVVLRGESVLTPEQVRGLEGERAAGESTTLVISVTAERPAVHRTRTLRRARRAKWPR